ncbi:hypothetical protein ABDD95_18530 [Mucilaginibacter sp. PAMB04274]|uniref:hypothetical protein n=1 Tax=Mucilaginibacter sp. PAMB04274 TaxID=3138568 RepID=UPI0031F5FC38
MKDYELFEVGNYAYLAGTDQMVRVLNTFKSQVLVAHYPQSDSDGFTVANKMMTGIPVSKQFLREFFFRDVTDTHFFASRPEYACERDGVIVSFQLGTIDAGGKIDGDHFAYLTAKGKNGYTPARSMHEIQNYFTHHTNEYLSLF